MVLFGVGAPLRMYGLSAAIKAVHPFTGRAERPKVLSLTIEFQWYDWGPDASPCLPAAADQEGAAQAQGG